jgi:diguanylate cyclase (GGDEF)-like protein
MLALFAWPVGCALVGCLLWAWTLANLHLDETDINKDVHVRVTSLAKTYAAQAARTVEQIDQITLNLTRFLEAPGGAARLTKLGTSGLYVGSDHFYVSVTDRDGTIIASTVPRRNGLSASKTDLFSAHRGNLSKSLRVARPSHGLLSGRTVIRFSRRLDAPDGSFNGVVVVSVEPAYLAPFMDESSLGTHDFALLTGSDGGPLTTKTGKGGSPLPSAFRNAPEFDSNAGVADMPAGTFVDDHARIVAWQRLDRYPLIAAVGLSEQDASAPYERIARQHYLMATAASVFLLLLAASGMWFCWRLAWRKQQAEEVREVYRLATDGAHEGFYMLRALYDEDENLVDVLVEDCNERGATLLGRTKQQLVGAKVSDFSSRDYAEHVLGVFRRTMETGFEQEDIKVAPGSMIRATWVCRKLIRAGSGIAMTLRDISDIKAHEQTLAESANRDVLTHLPNRHWLISHLPNVLLQARQENTLVAVLFVDLDDFKNVNDTVGHAAGDELLQGAARRLQHVIRPDDHVVRLGGDEFTIILSRVDSADDVSRLAERVTKALEAPFALAGGSGHLVRASIGISMFPQDGEDGDTLLKHADIAMYAAKAKGKGTFVFYEPQFAERRSQRVAGERALREAIERGEMVLHYQPRVDTFSGELRSMEALVRWAHPERGLVYPQAFIQMAEDTGLITELGKLVIDKTLAQLAEWQTCGLPLVPVSINVSARQFDQGSLSDFMASRMVRYGVSPSLVEIEITESCMIEDGAAVAEELAALEALGVKLLVDDFGTGYSSLSQLQRLELDGLKVDRAFTAALGDGDGQVFFKAILSMAKQLRLSVVAEGVETAAQLHILQTLSCNEIQGDFVSRPVPACDVPALLHKRFLFPAFDAFLQSILARKKGEQLFLGL